MILLVFDGHCAMAYRQRVPCESLSGSTRPSDESVVFQQCLLAWGGGGGLTGLQLRRGVNKASQNWGLGGSQKMLN